MTRWDTTAVGGRYAYAYAVPGTRPAGRVTTSFKEIGHILIAAIVLAADMALIISREALPAAGGPTTYWLAVGGTGAAAALTGFVFHELAHKIAAQRRGYWAEFRMSPMWLFLSFVVAYAIGFLFAAPGATVVAGVQDPRDWGRIALAGPLLNLAEGAAFLGAVIGAGLLHLSALVIFILLLLTYFNAWFATFNLIPLGPLDGRKVWRWNRPVWAATIAVGAVLAIYAYLGLIGTVPI